MKKEKIELFSKTECNYKCHQDGSNWSVYCNEKEENERYLKQTVMKLCSVAGYYRFLLFDLSLILIACSVNGFYSLIIVNFGTIHITYHVGIILLNTSMC